MALKRYADAVWAGDLQSGKGSLSTPQSGLFEGQNYSFKTRFGDEKGTNPEELLAVAHAGCFTMALSVQLTLASGTFIIAMAMALSALIMMENRHNRRRRNSSTTN